MTEYGSIEALNPQWRELAFQVFNRVKELGPDLSLKIKWGHPVLRGNKDIFAITGVGKGENAHINLQLFFGATLDNSHGLIEGTGKTMRHIKFYSSGDLDRDGVNEAIKNAIVQDMELN